ncbi:MAG: hypothetical protein AAF193_08940, partial [Bacteroidota bacterium]
MGIYSVFPVLLFVGIPRLQELQGEIPWHIPATGLLLVMSNIAVIWFFNILLWMNIKKSKRTVSKWYHNRILLSYLSVVLLVLLMIGIDVFIKPPEEPKFPRIYFIVANFANNSVILLLMTLFESQREKAELILQKTQIEKDHIQSLQDQWKQQIHPHFLFN